MTWLLWCALAAAEPVAPEAPAATEPPAALPVDGAPAATEPPSATDAPASTAPSAPVPIAGVAPGGPPPPPEAVEPLTREISARLRCPVCQGMSVADSPAESAVTMKGRIRELVAQGYDEAQIRAYFVGRYGEWVLLDPPATGLNWLLWLAPAALLGFGLTLAAAIAAQWRKEPDDVPLPSDQGLVPKDPYEERLLAELED